MSFVRTPSNSGILDVVNGTTLNGFVGFGADRALIFAENVNFRWALEATSGGDDDTDGSEIDEDMDSDSESDGATAITTFGAAVIAAIASIAF